MTAPLRVAVVGSGPAGFYASAALLDGDVPVEVDMIERLPTPWGLVRLGVAPDHPKLKSVSRAFERIADKPGFRLLGNVEVGRDLHHDDLVRLYDVVVYAVGAQTDRRLGIPGEGLPGSWSAFEFVAWYNGHPDYQDLEFDLDVLGRRGPAEAAFTPVELGELADLAGADVVVDPHVLEGVLNESPDTRVRRNLKTLHELALRASTGKPKTL